MNKKQHKEISHPPLLPTVSPGEIIELLKVQRAKGEELLRNRSLSPGDLQYWNLSAKEIITKAFGPSREYVDSILYSGEDKPLSVYEPESNMEKLRRKNLQMAIQAVEKCMEQVLLRGSPKGGPPKEAKGAKNTEPEGLPQIPEERSLQQEKKDLAKELSAGLPVLRESTSQETSQRVESIFSSETARTDRLPRLPALWLVRNRWSRW